MSTDGGAVESRSLAGTRWSLTDSKLAAPVPSAAAVQKSIDVAADRAPCVGVAPMQCLQVRDGPEQPWRLFYGEIIGFTHESGVEYRLRILEDDVPNPPADGSAKRWFLDQVVEQRVVRPDAR
jgi:hypothetical protein